jgi:hypothetical protein
VVVVALAATVVSSGAARASTSASATTSASTSALGAVSPWSLAALPANAGQWSAVTYAAGLFVALGRSPVVATSRTGTAWDLHPAPGGAWSSVAFGDGEFVALSSSSSGAREMRSTNGVEWTRVNGPLGQWSGVAFGAGRFVAVGSDGRIATSADGLTWRTVWVHAKLAFTSVAYGNGRFIAVDEKQGDDLISLDGLDWSFYQITSAHQRWSGVTFGDGNFVTFNNSRRDVVASSVLGYTWTAHVRASAQILNAAAYGCDTFVALGHATQSPGRFLTSPTGAAWTSKVLTVDALARWTAIAFGASRFVAVSSDGHIASLRASADCARATPSAPRDVSGNIPASGHVWTYMHPPTSAGDAPIDGYLVTVSDGVSASTCWAHVYYQPNCVVAGLRDRRIYYVTTRAHNRYGYSVPSDPEWVITVPSWDLAALSPTRVVPATSPVLVEVTGVRANAEGIYPQSTVTIHVGERLFYCQPSWFGECVVRVSDPRPGRTAIYATYVGYGQSYRSPTSYVTVTP